MTVELVLGAHQIDRKILDAADLLQRYRQDTGRDYLDYVPITDRNMLVLEDLAVTLLVNSNASWQACKSLMGNAASADLHRLPQKPLEHTSPAERLEAAEFIASMTSWPWFGASLATKVLHKKRPQLIPILDNQAIFGAYMHATWPDRRASTETIKSVGQIADALEWIYVDITREENATAWRELSMIEPSRTRIQLFDSVWWMYFRTLQPVDRPVS